MKKNIDPPEKDMDAFDLLDKIPGVRHGPGGVICLYDRLVSFVLRAVFHRLSVGVAASTRI